MNRDETIELYSQGREAWNEWAEGMLAERAALEDAGEWALYGEFGVYGQNDQTRKWMERANADFSGHIFDEFAQFKDFIFPHDVNFGRATIQGNNVENQQQPVCFKNTAWFENSHFHGAVSFRGAIFKGMAFFHGARFEKTTGFNSAHFSHHVDFGRVIFEKDVLAMFESVRFGDGVSFNGVCFGGEAWFKLAVFEGSVEFRDKIHEDGQTAERAVRFEKRANFAYVRFMGASLFNRSVFEQEADFNAITCESAFVLDGVRFARVPNFRQAHFSEAPDMDRVKIAPSRKKNSDLIPYYRALKRIAIQGQDHEQEINFFAGELIAKGSFLGKLYGWLSDYGRSLRTPSFWWLVTMLYTAMFYHYHSLFRSAIGSCDNKRGGSGNLYGGYTTNPQKG